jgi:hypothetical protein
MKTFAVGILIASIIALVVGVGLQYVQFSADTTYSTGHTRLH